MARPVSPLNSNAKDLPVLVDPAGTPVLPLASGTRSLGALDYGAAAQVVVPGQPGEAAWAVDVSAQANTAATHAIVVEAPAGSAVRILRVEVTQPGKQTTAGIRVLQLVRTTAAGTAGAVTPAPMVAADGAFGGTCRARPTSLGAEGTVLASLPVYVPAALAAMGAPVVLDFSAGGVRAPVVPAGTANGIALRDPGAAGATDFAARVWFTLA